MNRDRFAVSAVIIFLVIAIALFLIIGPGRPPQNASNMPAQVNGSLNSTIADKYNVRINTSNVTPEAGPSGILPETNFSHSSPLVLEILRINNISTGYESYYYNTYDALVLHSNDSAYKEGCNYTFEIDEKQAGYWGMAQGVAPEELIPGTIIEIYDYRLFKGNIAVIVSADPYNKTAWDNAWKQKITIIGQTNRTN